MEIQVLVAGRHPGITDPHGNRSSPTAWRERTPTKLNYSSYRWYVLAESKQVLQQLQQSVIERQVDTYLDEQRACSHCGKLRPLKQRDQAPFRTLFGLVEVSNPRWQQCDCQPHPTKTLRPLAVLLPERTSPELCYLESELGFAGRVWSDGGVAP